MLKTSEISGEDLTGGYIIKIDKPDDQYNSINSFVSEHSPYDPSGNNSVSNFDASGSGDPIRLTAEKVPEWEHPEEYNNVFERLFKPSRYIADVMSETEFPHDFLSCDTAALKLLAICQLVLTLSSRLD